uniref:Uncharacterized protein n=1 Tax=Corethron hystrix TaxID=216773 RepID=A0A7S1BIM9_9STRA|mmetsp:Transcript_27854/g.63788  ORF Transcript_27854/g.63788 Transcript_27854/m.63788 type:complete len:234 (+) Transcript_27854:127-828(+)
MKRLNRHFFYSCRIGTHPSKDANWLKYECFVLKLIQPKKRTRNTEVEESSSNESDEEQSIKKIKIPASISSPWLSGEYRERKFRARDDEHCLDAIENMREICLKVMRRSYHGRSFNYNEKTKNTITPFYHSYIYQQAFYIRKTLAFAEECFPDVCSLVDCYKKAIEYLINHDQPISPITNWKTLSTRYHSFLKHNRKVKSLCIERSLQKKSLPPLLEKFPELLQAIKNYFKSA